MYPPRYNLPPINPAAFGGLPKEQAQGARPPPSSQGGGQQPIDMNKYLMNKVAEAAGSIEHYRAPSGNEYIKPPRKCIIELIERNIKREHSNHEHNNVIAFELINGGWSDRDISFVFKSIYNEPAGDWGWYSDDINTPGRHIEAIRAKAINRYSVDKLIQLGICKGDKCSCT